MDQVSSSVHVQLLVGISLTPRSPATLSQSPNRSGYFCTQGIINLGHNGPEDGGLLVLEGSSVLVEE